MSNRVIPWDALRESVAQMTSDEWSMFDNEADAYVADEAWNGRNVAIEWQEECDAQLHRERKTAVEPIVSE